MKTLRFVILAALLGAPSIAAAIPGETGVYGINDSGVITGYYFDLVGEHGFVEAGGVFTTINVPGGFDTGADGINDAGQVVGSYLEGGFHGHGFVESGGHYTTIDDPIAVATAGSTFASDINSAGDIVGIYQTITGGVADHGFVDIGGVFTTIDPPGGTFNLSGINSAGVIVGSNGSTGFVDDHGVFTTISDPLATLFTSATGINDAGAVVGYYDDGTASHLDQHGFMDVGGVYTTIDDPLAGLGGTKVQGINNAGAIVGVYATVDGPVDGFVDIDGVFTDVRDPLASEIPEPAEWSLMLIGFLGLGWAVRRGRTTRQSLA